MDPWVACDRRFEEGKESLVSRSGCSNLSPMDWARECAAIIPCLNEAATIADLIRGVRSFLPSILVVDDGSTDSTATRAAEAGAQVLRHPANRGKGAALRTGFETAQRQGFHWALTLDGDGQHSPEEIPHFLRCAEATGAALVIGNRMGQAATMPRLRRWTNRWMSRRLSKSAGRILPDSQSGFRLLDLKAWSNLTLETEHFEIESELLLACIRHGYRVEFTPVRMIAKRSGSKIHPLIDTWRWLRWWSQTPLR